MTVFFSSRPARQRYAIAIGIFGAAWLLRLLILPVEARLAFLTFYPAAVLAFLVAGIGPGRLMVVLCTLVGYYLFSPPHGSFELKRDGLLSASVFVLSAHMIGWVIERLQATATRLQAALAELHVTEQRYRTIVEEQAELVSLARADGELVYVNAAYARHFGRTPVQMAGTSLFDYVDPADRGAVAEQVRRVLHDGVSRAGENRMVAADGTEKWVAWTNKVQRNDAGQSLLHSVGRDITEHKELEQRVAESERFLRQITDSLPLRIAYVDKERRFRFINMAHSLRFARPRAEIIGRTRNELTLEPLDPAVEARYQAALAGQPQRFEFDESIGGELRRFETRLVPDMAPDGAVQGFVATGIDITERSAAEQALRRQTATLQSVTEAIPASVAVVGRDGRYRFVNSAFERWCGAPRDQIIGRTAAEVLGEQEFKRRWPWVERALLGESGTFALDYPGPDGTTYLSISYIPLRRDTGAVDGFVVVTQDITQQKREAMRLLDLSQRDPLTGLLNRSGFEQHLELAVHQGDGASIAVLYIDLDHFKPVNDRHGHPAGDQVLRLFAQRLLHLVRPSDAVARLGGDEFAIALVGVRDRSDAQAVADKVLAAAHTPFQVGSVLLSIGASVGVAHGIGPTLGWQELIERADVQLLSAKSTGRGRLSAE